MPPSDSEEPGEQSGDAAPDGGNAEERARSFADAEDNFGLTPKPKARLKRVDPLIGVDLGGVQITKLIGEGGMGRVYEARQARPDRVVAVKIVRHGITNEKTLRRFEREAEFLGKLQHPAIAQIFAVGTYESDLGDVPFFVMEHVPNARPITNYVHDQGLGLTERLRLFKQVCDAVSHGHDRGIVHRDLKPGNILISADGTPKVIDFGVARSTDSDLTLTKLRTDTGQLVGTLQYMSPEQFGDSPEGLDGRADVYSLGVVLYELVSGSLPYEIRKKAIHEASRVVCEEIPSTLRSRDKSCPREVSLIAERCLQKDRRYRYHGAGELAADLRRYLSGQPVLARPPHLYDLVASRVRWLFHGRRSWGTAALVGGVAAIATAVSGISFRQPGDVVPARVQVQDRGAIPGQLPRAVTPQAESPSTSPHIDASPGVQPVSPEGGLKVVLTREWTDLGIRVARGVCYQIDVSGLLHDDEHGPFGADGSTGVHGSKLGPRPGLTAKTRSKYFEGGHPRHAVLARIGDDPRTICVGKNLIFISPSSGQVSLRLNESDDSPTRASGTVAVQLEPRSRPGFVDERGVTAIHARILNEAFLILESDGLRWRRAESDDTGGDYPVFINKVAWFPDGFDPVTSEALKTGDFIWATTSGSPPPLVRLAERSDPGSHVELTESEPGTRAIRLFVTEGQGKEIRCELLRDDVPHDSGRGKR